MILHFSQIFLTDGLTFISFIPIGYSAVRQIVGRKLHEDAISRQNTDEVHPDLAGNVREHAMSVRELDAEHCIRKRLDDRTLDLNGLFPWSGRLGGLVRRGFLAPRNPPAAPSRHYRSAILRYNLLPRTVPFDLGILGVFAQG